MIAQLLFVTATVIGGDPAVPPPPPPVAVTVAVPGHIDAEPVQATPAQPIHDGRPQEPGGQSIADAVTITDDGFGFPVETGAAEVRHLSRPRDLADLAELCGIKPWLCDDSYARK